MLKKVFVVLTLLIFFSNVFSKFAFAAGGLTLYTPYTGIAVIPGESIDYAFDLMNETSQVQQVTFEIEDLPKDWEYDITSSGWNLKQLSVKPDDSQTFSINLEVPLNVPKGEYTFYITATSTSGLMDRLPMKINISEEGTFKTELTSEQTNMKGHAQSTFNYELALKNRTSEAQHYALKADAPRGWDVNFQVDDKSVTSVSAKSNETKNINVVVTPPEKAEAGTYPIPLTATTNATSAELTLETVITGTYGITLSTPTGRLSEDILVGKEESIELEVSNTGTVPIGDITLNSEQPVQWNVQFEPKKINILKPGESEKVTAIITPSDKAIAGDYVIQMEASTPEAVSTADFRMQVETSMLWGWVGVVIIIAVIGCIFYLVRKYGRR
ncbi:COG1470 family protein [Bacillus sp. Marseille-P3661]|uniref:COG1470 family protein n=1 Tax=Bacillus sp. Marseille-P3661 TaxID=1936234 RepID=UPI000C81CCAD|nr:NEW3 domain-containing protein [Bacillus sp. Marseille-P3661]